MDATVDGEPLGDRITAFAISPDEVDLDIDGVRRRYAVHQVGGEVYVDGGGASTAFTEVPRFPPPGTAGHAGSLVAPTPGMVVRVLAAEGDQVAAGQPLVVLEAMKMGTPTPRPSTAQSPRCPSRPGTRWLPVRSSPRWKRPEQRRSDHAQAAQHPPHH